MKFLEREQILELCAPARAEPLARVAFDWFVILLAATLAWRISGVAAFLAALVLIGNRQHGLLVLMHEASHGRLWPTKNGNACIGELFCAWPLFIGLRDYRERHAAHHLYANSDLDPDFRGERFPRTRGELLRSILKDLCGGSALAQISAFARSKRAAGWRYRALQWGYYATLAAALTAFGLWKPFLLFWILPRFTWVNVALRLRAVADHAGTQHHRAPFDTRTLIPTFVDRLVWAPHSCSYHIGHHLYPKVPCFRLKRLHALLMDHPEFRRHAHITFGLRGLLREIPAKSSDIARLEAKGLDFTRTRPQRKALA